MTRPWPSGPCRILGTEAETQEQVSRPEGAKLLSLPGQVELGVPFQCSDSYLLGVTGGIWSVLTEETLTCSIPRSAGKALTFIKEKVLTWESGMRKSVPKVLVVVTDGRSQDEVKRAALAIQHSGGHGRRLHAVVASPGAALGGRVPHELAPSGCTLRSCTQWSHSPYPCQELVSSACTSRELMPSGLTWHVNI